ncbi:MAG: gamma-glutamylcyclotransferase [Rubrivivax sp.]
MSVLSRQSLDDGSFRQGLAMPAHLAWSDEQIEASLAEALAARPPGAAWVFGYGSLMWNPLLHVAERRVATLEGWQRSFCLRTTAGRGRPERPGRMLSLEPGGQVQGLALRLHDDEVERELRLLWRREMAAGAYRPLWAPVALQGGGEAQALVFVCRPGHPMHESDSSVAAVAPRVAEAVGAFGPNVDYLRTLARSLADLGLHDPRVDELLAAVDALGVPPAVNR